MAARQAATTAQKAQRELADLQLVLRARNGAGGPLDVLLRRYTGFVRLEAHDLRLYLEGSSYEQMAEELGCDTKTIDNALQRVKRKILTHQQSRQVLL